jgi:hypothetical protein
VITGSVSDQPGNAPSDIAAVALLLSSAAILVNAVSAGGTERRLGRSLVAPVIFAGLAAGLAAGTKLFVLAPVFALSIGIVVIATRESRRAIAAAWLVPVVAAGGYWYFRNLLNTGNPLPYFKLGLGSLSLPATHLAIEQRPGNDITLAHYLTDFDVWRALIVPGFALAFGRPWFLLLGFSVIAAIALLFAVQSPIRRVLAAAVLFGLLAYVLTPGTASGPEGTPFFVGRSARYAAPTLALGLALLPTIPALAKSAERRLVTLALLGVVLASRLDLDAMTADPSFDTCLLITAVVVGVLISGSVVSRSLPRGELIAAVAAVGALAIGLYWGQARDYLDQRYTNVWPALHLSPAYSWASGVSHARIAVAGTSGAFLQYGLYGRDVSNKVVYLARHKPRGEIIPYETCAEWRQALLDGRFKYVVTTPNFDPESVEGDTGFAPEDSWTLTDPAVTEVVRDGPVAVYSINGALDPAGCALIKPPPFAGLPPLLPRRP